MVGAHGRGPESNTPFIDESLANILQINLHSPHSRAGIYCCKDGDPGAPGNPLDKQAADKETQLIAIGCAPLAAALR